MDAYLDNIHDILKKLKDYLEENEDEVLATLQSAAHGDLDMPETITPKEKELFRALCGWMVAKRPTQILAMLQPLLADPNLLSRGITLNDIESVMPKELPPKDIIDTIKTNRRDLIRQALLLISYIFYDEFHYPQPETGVYDISENSFQKLKWLYRYWFNQLEAAETGSGLEDFFASQFLNLRSTEGPYASASVSCAGDLLAVDALTPNNTQRLFDDINSFYSTADIVSANLEATIDKNNTVGRIQSPGQPARMNTSEAMFQKFRNEAKINYFSTATNHAMDGGVEGIKETLKVLEDSEAYYSGTATSQADQDDVVVVNKNGIKIALLAYTFDLNGYEKDIPADMPYLVNVVRFNDADPAPDYSLIEKQVVAAKAKGADWIIAYCHWGWEFEMYPHENIRKAAHKVIDCGVDTILGNHAHVSQPAELIPREGKQDALVVYAFGDFVSYHPESRNSKLAYIVKFDIVQVYDAIELANLKALPIYIANAKRDDDSYDCRIVKFHDVLKTPDEYGLTELEKSQLPHLEEKVWHAVLSPLSRLGTR
ncbi:CapA family protein [Halomonas citrativorans]|uniref:CapA family protein n=1 Tax=Halomonas citrativorans TaxID=2742612 RepID=A0ABR9F8M3_9GAMM|nr:CapA family protein [Halomonas citrativorans]MBE0402731.1 CapA family protein [Halomonas citrativorans]